MVNQADRYLINSVLRAAQILQSYSLNKTSYTNAELSRRLGLNRSTVTRLLYSLERAGFLERENKTAEYRLTHELYRIGNIYIHRVDLHREAMPLLSEMAASCKETVHLAVLHESEVFFIDRVESPQSVVTRSLAGAKYPAYCTAIGKVLLANMDPKSFDAFLKKVTLKALTPNTITDIHALKEHLKAVRKQGYAIDNIEHELEIKSVACPVHDASGQVVAGISIAGPVFRMTDERILKDLVPAVTQTSKQISARLGYQAPEK